MDRFIKAAYFSNDRQKHDAHHHDCHQIILILKGNIQYAINDVAYHASRGDIVITSRYEKHSVQILSNEYERYVLHLSPFAKPFLSNMQTMVHFSYS